MKISLLKSWITLQKQSIVVDEFGARSSHWDSGFTCHAALMAESGSELDGQGRIQSTEGLTFIIRCFEKAKEIEPLKWRVLFRGKPYDIVFIDHDAYNNKLLKLQCKKAVSNVR